MKKLIVLIVFVCVSFTANAQTEVELKKELKEKKGEISKLQKEAKGLQSKIDALPGWKIGAFGTIGGNIAGFNNWYARTAPNTSSANIGISVNGFANLIKEDFFWRNAASVNLGWVKFDDKDSATDNPNFETATDVFNISSLYGRRLSKTWAISALGEYRTTIIENFNNPGYLDFGAGATWTPSSHLVVVIHPGNYNFVFSSGDTVFESSLGAKVVTDYTNKYGKLSVKSNLSMFHSYKSTDFSNWTLTNSLGYTIWKGVGVGFELGLRKNKQEALQNALIDNPVETFNSVDNKLQSYWLFGLSYTF
ncbi:DUF3078 domain-containing protein [Polaribacter sp.]|uniref:DUF3078 domain-containing protein n=1 Tax=Polaribacter sp. TaxID=1920175 RepID=UPI003F6A1015